MDPRSDRAEGDEICLKMVLILIIDDMKQSHPSTQCQCGWERRGFMKMEAVVLYVIGLFNMNAGSKESHQEALDHFRRAVDLFTLLGDEINMMTAKKNISKVEAKLNGIEYDEGSIILSFSQKQYNCWLKSLENITPSRLEEVSYYAHALYCLNQGVTAERLLTKLVAVQLLSTSAQLPPLERGWEKCPRFLTVFMAEKSKHGLLCVS